MRLTRMEAVRERLAERLTDKVPLGTMITLEYPGYIRIKYPDHHNTWAIGTANGVWGGDLSFSDGALICGFSTTLTEEANVDDVVEAILHEMEI